MSWGGGGFFGPLVNPTARASAIIVNPQTQNSTAGITPAGLDDLRRVAREAYAKGQLAEAADIQTAVIAAAGLTNAEQVEDFLFAGLILHGAHRITDGIRVLRDGAACYPANAPLQENLAVLLIGANDAAAAIAACEAALQLGSDSPNVYDCLCEAQCRTGRADLAVVAGRAALEAKDRRFGASPPVAAIPEGHPPAFNPGRPEENVIAYTLWGNEPRYHVPLLENVRLLPHLFPAWTIRVYHDHIVDPAYLDELAARGVQLRPKRLAADEPLHRGLLWRFDVIADPAVRRFLIRDADSLLTVKERVAVDAWLASGFHFHAMRDWYTHTDLILAGMWGGVGGILPAPAELMRARTFWRAETNHIDQDLLTETVWPAVRGNVLIHDSVFAPCLGSVPFPPFGAPLAGNHIGQNAFPQFSRSG
jgi:hypothetical protein